MKLNKQVKDIINEWCKDTQRAIQAGYTTPTDGLMLSMNGSYLLSKDQAEHLFERSLGIIQQCKDSTHPAQKDLVNEARAVVQFFQPNLKYIVV